MFKFRSIVSLFLLTVILPVGGNGPISPVHLFYNNKHFVNVSIDKIQFLGNTGDVSGNGEFRLLVLSADTKGKSSGTFCPGTGPIVVKTGDSVSSPCLNTITFDEDTVAEGVFLTIMALDEDKSSLPKDLTYELVSNQLGSALGKAVGNKAIKVAALSIPYAVPIEILVSLLTGKVKSWIEQADIVGAQGIYLSRNDNWSATGKAKTVTSSDGGIKITYTVTRSSVAASQPTQKSSATPSSPKSTKTPQSVDKPARMYDFSACIDTCNGSNGQTTFPANMYTINISWKYSDIPSDAHYVRYWKHESKGLWMTYDCTWDRGTSGEIKTKLYDNGGLAAGKWTVTMQVNGSVVLQKSITIQGSEDYWDPWSPLYQCI